MRKATKLLTMCIIWTAALACTAAYAAAAPEDDAVSLPASPSGSVYTAGPCGQSAAARTTVDLVYDGGGEDSSSGVLCDSGNFYYYGAEITGVDHGVILDGAESCYFGSSNGAIPLHNERGTVSGIVWGDRRETSVECNVGFLLCAGSSRVFVEDSSSFTCHEAVIRSLSGSGDFLFCNTRLVSDAGILAETEGSAGALDVVYTYGAYRGDHINGGSGDMSVTVGQGAVLFGDTQQLSGPVNVTVSAGGVWAVDEQAELTSLTVEAGGTVYGELTQGNNGSLVLLPSDAMLEQGTYQAEPISDPLPFGHGPAVAADTEEPDEADPNADKLFPLVPGAPMSPEDAEDPVVTDDAEDTSLPPVNEEDPVVTDDAEDTSLPPVDTEDVEEPAPTPEEADPGPVGLSSALLDGVVLARQTALAMRWDALSPSIDLATQLASPRLGGSLASLLKVCTKNHSFLPEALDNRAIILYNPYYCLAA